MISKLPRWIWLGAWVLSFVAGFINVIGFLGFEHQAISHLTGTTSMPAVALAPVGAVIVASPGLIAWYLVY
jgi:uncharacterized membrane protein YoaK (UPF0700 family)